MESNPTKEIPQNEIEAVTDALETVLEQGKNGIDTSSLAQVKLAHETISKYANGEKTETVDPYAHLTLEQTNKILQIAVDFEVQKGAEPKEAAALVDHLSTAQMLERIGYSFRKEELSQRFGFYPETGTDKQTTPPSVQD